MSASFQFSWSRLMLILNSSKIPKHSALTVRILPFFICIWWTTKISNNTREYTIFAKRLSAKLCTFLQTWTNFKMLLKFFGRFLFVAGLHQINLWSETACTTTEKCLQFYCKVDNNSRRGNEREVEKEGNPFSTLQDWTSMCSQSLTLILYCRQLLVSNEVDLNMTVQLRQCQLELKLK